MTSPQSSPEWAGELLNRPEMVEAFSVQLRRMLSDHADFVARIRRDAEAMWDANPPEGYSTFEGWWRAKWVKGPLADIQDHLEKAAALTFKLEARYRKGRHELPAKKQAKRVAAQKETPALGSGEFGRRTQQRPAPRPADNGAGSGDFMELVRERGERSA